MSEELKPCPFCGGEAKKQAVKTTILGDTYWGIKCTKCNCGTVLVKPDVHMDFRDMPYTDNSFKIVVFDPPHLIHAGTGSWLRQKYGVLPADWPTYLKPGFDECRRVLEPYGLLVFKWNEDQIKLSEVLKAFGTKPLLGDQRGKTRWLLFMK